ncbi:ribokinase [Agromyces silvae]|uniref:ribokinase n=1 Tax=Agromyces silvae TaxID=3388266 RepID=UPI00280AA6F9|nr:ribokinase [Agromyces protaetiae]
MAGDSLPGHGRTPVHTAVAVVGSLNLDLIARVPHMVAPGETILAEEFGEHPGGKGLNQAVAAARFGPTALVGAVGDDDSGRTLLDYARSRGVDVTAVERSRTTTGRALITLTPDGENSIVVAPLANMSIQPDEAVAALARLAPSVVLIQFEIPVAVVDAVAAWTSSSTSRLVVNPSPIRAMSVDALASADPLLVNVGEARDILTTIPPSTIAAAGASSSELARALSIHCRSVVVTAGPDGAVVGIDGEIAVVPAPRVDDVRDSSGAGDAFAGTLCVQLAHGKSLHDATRVAVEEAARIVAATRDDR